MAVVHSGDYLSEEVAGILLAEPLPLADIVVQVTPAGILHDDDNLAAVLKHWGTARWGCQALQSALLPTGGHTLLPGPKPDRTFLQGYLPTGWDRAK